MKRSLKNLKIVLAVFTMSLAVMNTATAQCTAVTKDAIKKLTVYTHTGQTNSAAISGGNKVEMHLSFYKGLNYKLQFGADAALGQYKFRILDENKKELYKFDGGSQADYFTFFSNCSQELIIEISAVDNTKKGCVAVVVGMQAPKTGNNSIRNL
jgi:hypothetical protein